MMRRVAGTIFVGMLVWTGAILPAWFQHAAPAGAAASKPYWTYRWLEQADGTTQVWRRPASNPESSWIPVGTVPEAVSKIEATAADPDLAVALTEKALYRSRDAGETWTALPNLPSWPTAVDLGHQSAGVLYLGTLTGGAFRSADAGDTWQALSSGLGLLPGTFLEVTALEVHPEDEETVYAATGYWLGTTEMHFSPLGVFLSLDAGATWLLIEEPEPNGEMITSLTPAPDDPLAVQVETATANIWVRFRDRTVWAE
jgi:hypothetical protein